MPLMDSLIISFCTAAFYSQRLPILNSLESLSQLSSLIRQVHQLDNPLPGVKTDSVAEDYDTDMFERLIDIRCTQEDTRGMLRLIKHIKNASIASIRSCGLKVTISELLEQILSKIKGYGIRSMLIALWQYVNGKLDVGGSDGSPPTWAGSTDVSGEGIRDDIRGARTVCKSARDLCAKVVVATIVSEGVGAVECKASLMGLPCTIICRNGQDTGREQGDNIPDAVNMLEQLNRFFSDVNCDYVLVADSMVELNSNVITVLMEVLDNPRIAIASPSIVRNGKSYSGVSITNTGAIIENDSSMFYEEGLIQGTTEVDSPSSDLVLLKRSVIVENGGFDINFSTFDAALADMSLTLRSSGLRVAAVQCVSAKSGRNPKYENRDRDLLEQHHGRTLSSAFRGTVANPFRQALARDRISALVVDPDGVLIGNLPSVLGGVDLNYCTCTHIGALPLGCLIHCFSSNNNVGLTEWVQKHAILFDHIVYCGSDPYEFSNVVSSCANSLVTVVNGVKEFNRWMEDVEDD